MYCILQHHQEISTLPIFELQMVLVLLGLEADGLCNLCIVNGRSSQVAYRRRVILLFSCASVYL